MNVFENSMPQNGEKCKGGGEERGGVGRGSPEPGGAGASVSAHLRIRFRRGRRPRRHDRTCANFPAIRRAGGDHTPPPGSAPHPPGRSHGPCPTKITAVGRDPCVPPHTALLVNNDVIAKPVCKLAVAIRNTLRRASCTRKCRLRGTFCQQRQKVPKERRQNPWF